MKKYYILILIFIWSFHCLFPFIIEQLYGKIRIYEGNEESDIGFYINTIFIVLCIFLIQTLKAKNIKPISPFTDRAYAYFVISGIIFIINFFSNGGFVGIIEGRSSGTLFSYLSLFFNLRFAFLFVLYFQKNLKYFGLTCVVYLILVTIGGSRSGAIGLITAFLYFPFFSNYHLVKRKIRKYVYNIVIIAPMLFIFASSQRGMEQLPTDLLVRMIVGRISMNELSSIPLVAKEKDSYNKKIYNEKYALSNQIEQSLNVMLPIDIFTFDVNPNQYYRAAFFNYGEDYCRNNYMSINMTYPVYCIMESGYVWGIFISVFSFFLLIKISWNALKKKRRIIFFLIITNLYPFWYFFDFPHEIGIIYSSCLTYLCFWLFCKVKLRYLPNIHIKRQSITHY